MVTTDDFIEREYNNRALVPEHPAFFARWDKDSAYVRRTLECEVDVPYGTDPRHRIDLFPARAPRGTLVFIHGGYWRSLEPSMFSQMAAGPNARGVTVAVAGYDLCPRVSIADIIEQMRAACLMLWRKRRQRVFVYGHSAGGHLAACMAATDWKAFASDAPADLVPATYAISGVFELMPLVHVSMNQDLRLDEADARRVSPLHWNVPAGRSLDAVVGALESDEFLRQSKSIAEAWRRGPTLTRYEEIAETNHFTVVDPLTDPNSAMTARVAALAQSTNNLAL